MDFQPYTQPQSTEEKTLLAKSLFEELKQMWDAKDMVNWYEGKMLYYFNKFRLYSYLYGEPTSQSAFYAEVDIPISTAQFKAANYDFYVVKHGFTFKQLRDANTKKLNRAIQYCQTKTKEEMLEVIKDAKRREMGLRDFLINLGAPDLWCVHTKKHKESQEVEICDECHKKVNGKHPKK